MDQWYFDYCKSHNIPIKYGKDRIWHEKMLRRADSRAKRIEDVDINGLSFQDAKSKLENRGKELECGMSGLSLLLFRAILSWIIGAILDRAFSNSEVNNDSNRNS